MTNSPRCFAPKAKSGTTPPRMKTLPRLSRNTRTRPHRRRIAIAQMKRLILKSSRSVELVPAASLGSAAMNSMKRSA